MWNPCSTWPRKASHRSFPFHWTIKTSPPSWSGLVRVLCWQGCHTLPRTSRRRWSRFVFSLDAKWTRSNTCTDTGAQPLVSEDGKFILTVNGEIYNHFSLRASLAPGVKFKTHSDCEIILPLVRGPITLSVHPSAYIRGPPVQET